MAVLSLPFAVGRGYGWLIDLYSGTLASYPYASLERVQSVWHFLGGNFIDINSSILHFSYQLDWVGVDGAVHPLCLLFIGSQQRIGVVPLLYMAFLFITAVFICMTKMHERYLHYGYC